MLYLCPDKINTEMQQLIARLHHSGCVLVVRDSDGNVSTYNQRGVRDLVWLLDNEPERLHGAVIADKVIGKAAAGLLVRGGVSEAYADVMSRAALPLLDEAGVTYTYGELVEHIVIPEGDTRCPLELIVATARNAEEVETMLRQHFCEMKRKKHLTPPFTP